MSNERKRRDVLASLLPGSDPAPAEDQRAGPGTHGQPSLPAPAHSRGQFLVHFFAAWVTWMRVGSAHGCRQQLFPPQAVSSSGVQSICTQLPSIPSSPVWRCPAPPVLMARLKDVTKGRQDPEFMASTLLGLPQGGRCCWVGHGCAVVGTAASKFYSRTDTSSAQRLPFYPCWHQFSSQCRGSEPCRQPRQCYSLAEPVQSPRSVWTVAQ